MKYSVADTETTAPDRRRAEAKSGSGQPVDDQEEIRQKVEAAATPGPGHNALAPLIGDWEAEVKCWREPGGPLNVSYATATTEWTLDRHFLKEQFHGEMMGKPFHGLSLMGYDNTKQTFNMVWVSDAQTSMFTSEGKGESNNKVITLKGKTSCAATGRNDVPMKTVFRVFGPGKHVFEMYDQSRAESAKIMEITYLRR